MPPVHSAAEGFHLVAALTAFQEIYNFAAWMLHTIPQGLGLRRGADSYAHGVRSQQYAEADHRGDLRPAREHHDNQCSQSEAKQRGPRPARENGSQAKTKEQNVPGTAKLASAHGQEPAQCDYAEHCPGSSNRI